MAVICASCGRVIKNAVYFCRQCRLHFAWDCTDNGDCPRCGHELVRM